MAIYMAEERFSDLGRVEAIAKLYEGTPYKPYKTCVFETSGKSYISTQSRVFIEGIDFDLVYFPLKHLGYKCVTAVTGELYAEFSHPRTMDLRIGISSKLDFSQIREVWEGMVTAAKEHGYKDVSLDLVPSPNGLTISISSSGETSLLMAKRRPAAKSMDLICVSDNLGAAFMGFQVLEREKRKFEQSGDAKAQPDLDSNKNLIGEYHKPSAKVLKIIDDGQQKGLTMAVFSDYGCVEEKLRAIGIDSKCFALCVDAPSLGALKPEKTIVLDLLKQLNADPRTTLFIGDRDDKDGEAARVVGAHFMHILNL